jgi:hypothetical protein
MNYSFTSFLCDIESVSVTIQEGDVVPVIN